MSRLPVVVVGGGLGGLAVAVRLAAAGRRVILCERNDRPGGKMNRFESTGFTFDTGPSLITMPAVFAELFEAAGERMDEHVRLSRIDPLIMHVFDDGARFETGGSIPALLEAVGRIAPGDEEGVLALLHLGARLYEVSRRTFLSASPFSIRDALAAPELLRDIPLLSGWGNYSRTVAAHVRSPRLRQVFNRYPTYVGSSPYAAPATLLVIPYIEFAFGGWYAQGGLYRIVEALEAIALGLGVELRLSAPVERIEARGDVVSGVRLASGEVLASDCVIMNGDDATLGRLLNSWDQQPPPAARRSLSGLVLLLGLRRDRPDLAHHAVLFGADSEREFRELFDEREFPSDPTIYLNAASRTDRSLVPGQGEALFVMANAAAAGGVRGPAGPGGSGGGSAWDERAVARARERILARLARGGCAIEESEIAAESVWTPTRFERTYDMPGGAIYGAASHGWQGAFFRPPNRHERIGGLYRVGGSSHPGGGTPTVLLSAAITARLVQDDAAMPGPGSGSGPGRMPGRVGA